MKVYCILVSRNYEGEELVDLFESRKDAEFFRFFIEKQKLYDRVYITEKEIVKRGIVSEEIITLTKSRMESDE